MIAAENNQELIAENARLEAENKRLLAENSSMKAAMQRMFDYESDVQQENATLLYYKKALMLNGTALQKELIRTKQEKDHIITQFNKAMETSECMKKYGTPF